MSANYFLGRNFHHKMPILQKKNGVNEFSFHLKKVDTEQMKLRREKNNKKTGTKINKIIKEISGEY
jgi:hypothetical protein